MPDPITAPPPAPGRNAPSIFSTLADAFLAWFAGFVIQLNAVVLAMNWNALTSTSTTSLAIGTGAKSLTVDVSKGYLPGHSVKIARTAAPSNWMHGDVTSYNSGTGALVVNVTTISGSGTFTDWTVTFSAPISPGLAITAGKTLTVSESSTIAAELHVTQPTHLDEAKSMSDKANKANSALTGITSAEKIVTAWADLSAVANNTPTTIFATVSFFSCLVNVQIINYGLNGIATATAFNDSSGTFLLNYAHGANITITVSGNNVQITQTSGAARDIRYSYLRVM